MLASINKLGTHVDDRGPLAWCDSIPFDKIKRFYVVENFSTETVRAFHGHRHEEKYLYVSRGSAVVVVAPMFTQEFPDELAVGRKTRHVLSARIPSVLHIPAGHVNGFRALEPGTQLIFFSTSTAEESSMDDLRFPPDIFGLDIWKVENR